MIDTFRRATSVSIFLMIASVPAFSQGSYEVQTYASPTMAKGATMVELHSNFTFSGTKKVEDGVRPTNHQWHETLEITHGFTDWFETGFYIFTAADKTYGWNFVGSHIRPRVAVPESWKWPVGVSLSTEIGYQRAVYSADTWSWEIRPIIDKQYKKLYLAFNPSLQRSWHGPSVRNGVEFSPNFKAGWDFTKKISGGIEYYGALGPVGNFNPLRQQEQQILPAIDIDFGPQWEFNFGVGVGVTGSTDHLLVKMIVGRRFGGARRK